MALTEYRDKHEVEVRPEGFFPWPFCFCDATPAYGQKGQGGQSIFAFTSVVFAAGWSSQQHEVLAAAFTFASTPLQHPGGQQPCEQQSGQDSQQPSAQQSHEQQSGQEGQQLSALADLVGVGPALAVGLLKAPIAATTRPSMRAMGSLERMFYLLCR
jgi:hypothetical protein